MYAVEVGTWLPSTVTLLAYSGAHALTTGKAVSLILAGTGHEGLAVQGGMAVVALLAAALVYDNAMLASGRFLGQVRMVRTNTNQCVQCLPGIGYEKVEYRRRWCALSMKREG